MHVHVRVLRFYLKKRRNLYGNLQCIDVHRLQVTNVEVMQQFSLLCILPVTLRFSIWHILMLLYKIHRHAAQRHLSDRKLWVERIAFYIVEISEWIQGITITICAKCLMYYRWVRGVTCRMWRINSHELVKSRHVRVTCVSRARHVM